MILASTADARAELVVTVLGTLIAAGVLGSLGIGRRWLKRELVDPVRDLRDDFAGLRADFAAERAKRKRFQRKIRRQIAAAEVKAERERRAQIAERVRVGGREPGGS